MNKKEWNVIQKELNKYLPKGVSLRYDGIISTNSRKFALSEHQKRIIQIPTMTKAPYCELL